MLTVTGQQGFGVGLSFVASVPILPKSVELSAIAQPCVFTGGLSW